MKKSFKLMVAFVMGASMLFSCQQADEPMIDKGQESALKTRLMEIRLRRSRSMSRPTT